MRLGTARQKRKTAICLSLIGFGEVGGEIFKRQLRAWFVLLLSLAAVRRMRRGMWPKRFLHVAQVESDQSVGEKNGWDTAGAPKPVNGRFANL